MFTWHCTHATAGWAPVSGNVELLWLNVEGVHPGFVVWHEAHAVGNPAWGTGVVADANCAVWHV